MKAYWESGGTAPRILTSALDGGEWSVSRPGHFTPKERAPGTHWVGECTYINIFDTVAHHIFRLEKLSHFKDEISTTGLQEERPRLFPRE
jgi:hypothetical protein